MRECADELASAELSNNYYARGAALRVWKRRERGNEGEQVDGHGDGIKVSTGSLGGCGVVLCHECVELY